MTRKESRNEQIISAPVPLVLGDDTFLISPPTAADGRCLFRSYKLYLEKEPVSSGLNKDELALLTPAERVAFIQAFATERAKSGVSKSSPTLDGFATWLMTPVGAAHMIWVLGRQHQNGLKLSEVQKLITDENLEEVLADFDDLGIGLNKDESKPEKEPSHKDQSKPEKEPSPDPKADGSS